MASRVKDTSNVGSPASRVMDAAIELAIKGRSLYPIRASFVNHDSLCLAREIARAFDQDHAVVLVWPDGSARVLQPGDRIPAPAPPSSADLKASGSGIDLPAA
jgi:hypothetical protein